ncbi:MAG TPA: hypothetical protein VI248_14325 [Kineosporiaceae bacterium]
MDDGSDTHGWDHDSPVTDPGGAPGREHQVLLERLTDLESRLGRVFGEFVHSGGVLAANSGRLVPAWRRVTDGEPRLPVTIAVAFMIIMQALLPDRLTLTANWVMPVVETLILVVLFASNPRRVTHASRWLRLLSLGLIALASLANAWSAVSLVVGLVNGREGQDAGPLLITGGNIWLTNVVVFALWYWDLDRGGPGARARNERAKPDFLFPEMASADLADADWEPHFVDYLYLAYTNATAFSPTDTLPFSRWSKLAMMLQSAVSLATGALVIARAVNILR